MLVYQPPPNYSYSNDIIIDSLCLHVKWGLLLNILSALISAAVLGLARLNNVDLEHFGDSGL